MASTIQYIITGVALAAAVAYAVMRILSAVKAASDPCRGCAGCALDGRLRARQKKAGKAGEDGKMTCYNKKRTKKFGVKE